MFFRVNARVINKGEWKEVFFIAETGYETMADIHDAMVEDGSIHVTRYDTRGPNLDESDTLRGRRARIVVDEYEYILSRDGFTSMSEMMEDLIDKEGVTLFSMREQSPHRAVAWGR